MKLSITFATVFATIFLTAFLTGCSSNQTAKPVQTNTPYVKVFISKSGEITVDGKAATLDEVRRSFSSLKQKKGVVLYARESVEDNEPHPNAMRVIELVTQDSLAIRMCMAMDCSDALDANGNLIMDS